MVSRIGSWKDSNLQMKCAREAVKLIKTYIDEGISFNQETTLSGMSIINNIKRAKPKGYTIISVSMKIIKDKEFQNQPSYIIRMVAKPGMGDKLFELATDSIFFNTKRKKSAYFTKQTI